MNIRYPIYEGVYRILTPVFETDREIPFATHAVMYLHAFPCGDIGRNAPCPEIIQQDGVLKR